MKNVKFKVGDWIKVHDIGSSFRSHVDSMDWKQVHQVAANGWPAHIDDDGVRTHYQPECVREHAEQYPGPQGPVSGLLWGASLQGRPFLYALQSLNTYFLLSGLKREPWHRVLASAFLFMVSQGEPTNRRNEERSQLQFAAFLAEEAGY